MYPNPLVFLLFLFCTLKPSQILDMFSLSLVSLFMMEKGLFSMAVSNSILSYRVLIIHLSDMKMLNLVSHLSNLSATCICCPSYLYQIMKWLIGCMCFNVPSSAR